MKNDLISRKSLLAAARKVSEYDEAGFHVSYKAVPVEVIEKAPSIEAEPVRHARWIRANDEQAYFDVEYVCSGCQFVVAVSGIGTPLLYGYKHCPGCGLPMDAKEDA